MAVGTIKSEIEKGISQLYQTVLGNLLVVLRPEGSELVVVAVVGKNLKASQIEIINFAKSQGFSTIRFHARHPEYLRKGLQGLSYELIDVRNHFFSGTEYVYRINLGGL